MPFTKNVILEYVPPQEEMRGISLEDAMNDFLLAYIIGVSGGCKRLAVTHLGGVQ